MNRKILLLSLITTMFILSACSTSDSTFTPQVVEKATSVDVTELTPVPTETEELIETNESPQVIETEEEIGLSNVKEIPNPENYQWVEIVSGFSRPLGMTSILDENLVIYVLEQDGIIRVLENNNLLEEPFLDISNKVSNRGSEQGLLGIALDPDFLTNGEFYLNYTDRNGDTVIGRYFANPDRKTADVKSEQIILSVGQPYSNHNGGNLVFGPDGYLYIGLGDGGSGGDPEMRAQNPDTLLGKMLRIAVSNQEVYAIPEDNPFLDSDGRDEIFSIGLRNPWRYSFDRLTDDLWIADVGQGNWEEINFTPVNAEIGLNYGWYYFEGTHSFKGDPTSVEEYVFPVYEYDHSMGCSVTGGYVYRGETLQEWYGVYIFGDFCNGKVWGILPADNGDWKVSELFETGLNISSFGEDVFGELYLISHNGTLYKLQAK
jgi:glucose/arabinose dehydrogenase